MATYSQDPDKPLSDIQKRFVEEYMKHRNGAQAVMDAGYKCTSRISASNMANRLLKKCPAIKKLIAEASGLAAERAAYNQEMALKETDMMITEAREAGQYSAVAKLVEHKAKLCGLLIEKHDHRVAAGFQVNIQPFVPLQVAEQIETESLEVIDIENESKDAGS
jgi:phage terminase small subunit